jgi:benzoyl-CoA reductase/2-hydroxyglutaryl-CoA dehydratase subunit BcrC/BadD/HgdB
MSSSLVSPFKSAIEESTERLVQLSSEGKKIFGYFCTCTPIEIIHASGFIPIRITGEAGPVEKAYKLIPDFICPFLKRSMEKVLNGEYQYLSGIIQGYTCDAACGVVNIWESNTTGDLFEILPLPYNDNSGARKFFHSVIRILIQKLNNQGGNFSNESLEKTMKLYGDIRKNLIDIYNLRYKGQLPISSGELWYIIQAGFVTRPEEYLRLLENFQEEIKDKTSLYNKGIPVLISGSLVESGKLFEFLETCGAKIVADDLCTGIRSFYPAEGEGKDPLERLINRLQKKFLCPTRARAEERLSEILKLVSVSDAKGVVFIVQKFCTPHLSDYPFLSKEMKNHGIQSLLIEMDENWKAEAQLRTRIEGFLEMLE